MSQERLSVISEPEFAQLVRDHHADLMRLAFGMAGDRTIAEDAVQACWQEAWRSRSSLRDRDNVRGWLFTITANQARRQLRRRRLATILLGRLNARRNTELRPEEIDLAQAVLRLPLRDRQLISMRYSLGMTSDEISVHLGMTPSGTRVRLMRVLERLRRELGDE